MGYMSITKHVSGWTTLRLQRSQGLRSYSTHQLSVPRHNLTFGSRAFRFSAPRIWNSLPVSIRESQSLPTFRRHRNDILFSVSLPPFSCPPCLEYLRTP